MGTNWVVCTTLAHGCSEPSNLRTCRECHTQVWVPVAMTPLVDSGELRPICWPCHNDTGRSVTLHPLAIDVLTKLGRLDEGWRYIADINDSSDDDESTP